MHILGKRYRFSAAHRLCSPGLSEAANLTLYGRCANPSGHGHDYVLEFILSSESLLEDVVIGRGFLDQLVREHIDPRFAMQDLNRTFGPSFITSGENLAAAAHSLLAPHLPQGIHLTVRLEETERNSFAFDGE